MKYRLILALLLVVTLLGTSCTGKTASAPDTKRMEELGNAFAEELRTEYIPIRESLEELQACEAVLITEEKTYNISLLDRFYEEYTVGNTSSLVTIFKTKSFVVTKVLFEGGTGYYFRYELNPLEEKLIEVSSQPLDQLELVTDNTLKKKELTLLKEKQTPIVFSYKNIATEESAASS